MTYFLGVAFFCLVAVPGSLSNDDIHKYMSREEHQQVFQTDHDSVPEYEITKINLSEGFHKRDLDAGRKMHLRAFGDSINLWLHPTESVLVGDETPVYFTRASPGYPEGVEFGKWTGIMSNVGTLLEDPQHLASLVIGTEASGRTTVDGYIASKGIVVRSLPTRVAEEYRRRRRSIGDLDSADSNYHVVIKNDESYLENYPDLPGAVNAKMLKKRDAQNASTIPDTLYPEILVVVEHSMYESFKNDVYGLLKYLLAFCNGIDLKYRSLESPSYRFHIAGIVLGMYPEATPYITKHAIDADTFNYNSSIYEAAEFFQDVQDTFPMGSYDMSLTLTRKSFGVGENAGVLGVAFLASGCQKYKDEPFHNVALVKDNGAFKSVMLASHELGHLFGALHDKSGGDCVTQRGFIMAFTPWYTTNSSDFSPCSIKYFDFYLKDNRMDCLYNVPTVPGKILPKLMPGRMKGLEDQCKALGLLTPCQKENVDHDVCTNIYCLNEKGECSETGTAALAGTSCDEDGKFCLHMRCVKL